MKIIKSNWFNFIYLFILFITCILTFNKPSYTTEIARAETNTKPRINLVYIHSYSHSHPCTLPQREGFRTSLLKLTEKYQLSQHEYFMETNTKYTTQEEIKIVANWILEDVRKSKPDYIIITDDNAFKYCGIPLSNDGYKIIATGINCPLSEYKRTDNLNLNNMVIVEETVILDPVYEIFRQSRFSPDKYYVLYDRTITSYFMLKDYEKSLSGYGKMESIEINTIPELRKTLKELQSKPRGVIIVSLQSLFDPDLNDGKGGFVDKSIFFKEFVTFNTKHLELCANIIYSKYGYSISCGPDFYNMGIRAGDYFVEQVLNNKFNSIIMRPEMFLSINIQRLNDQHFKQLLQNNYKFPITTYNVYEHNDG